MVQGTKENVANRVVQGNRREGSERNGGLKKEQSDKEEERIVTQGQPLNWESPALELKTYC